MNDTKRIFTDRLRSLLIEKKIKQSKLAKDIDTMPNTVSNWLNTDKDTLPNVPLLVSLARYLNTSVDYLLGLSDGSSPKGQSDTDYTYYANVISDLFRMGSIIPFSLCAEHTEDSGSVFSIWYHDSIIQRFLMQWDAMRKLPLPDKEKETMVNQWVTGVIQQYREAGVRIASPVSVPIDEDLPLS